MWNLMGEAVSGWILEIAQILGLMRFGLAAQSVVRVNLVNLWRVNLVCACVCVNLVNPT